MLVNLRKVLGLMQLLPKTGSIADQLIAKDLAKRFGDLAEELKAKTNFVVQENGWATFDTDKDEDLEFALSEAEIHVLKRGVKALDEAESVNIELVDLCKEVLDL